ncbi:unnamed protein product [Peniophora sp. CBMAI 1063]|nr:unnamed protein product [Peniophora sp. CBMAI 1063]
MSGPSVEEMLEEFLKTKGVDERLQGLTDRHDVYPAVDPQFAFDHKSFAGKVVLITGASKGIGSAIATFFARAGAKLALIARRDSGLEDVKEKLQDEFDVEVLAFAEDVRDTQTAAKIVEDTVAHFGKIDVVIANAGVASKPALIGEADVTQWWSTLEVNLLGTVNYVAPALKHLKKTNGYVIVISSWSALLRSASTSDYAISKQVLNRFVEFVALEYAGTVKSFAIHPGAVWTDLSRDAGSPEKLFIDKPELAAATALALASGEYDWLSGRFIDATVDLGDVEKLKEQILSKDALVSKLVVL